MAEKRVLITGAAGFLGSYATEKYYNNGWKVTAIDNFTTSVVNGYFFHERHIPIFASDVLDATDFASLHNKKFNVILHLAAPVGPAGILKHSGKMAKYILEDVYWAIDMALEHDAVLLFVSTSEVYGWRDHDIDLKEDDQKIFVGNYKVRNEYSASKMLAEIVLSNKAKVTNLKYQIIRPFNISGARQLKDGGFVLPTFVTQALAGDPITVFGDGSQIRSFTHVQDIINGIYMTTEAPDWHMNEIWNLGTPKNKCTIMEMAQLVKKMTKSNSEIACVDPKTIHGPLYEEAWDKIANSEKITRELGWEAEKDIEYIVQDVINYYEGR